MIKKIILPLMIFCIIVSCGKKGDPEYNDSKKKVEIQALTIKNA
tara:strand:+ start:236 stop:367 length:132 start_codon:yes stop_codon:yes gene_type:complete